MALALLASEAQAQSVRAEDNLFLKGRLETIRESVAMSIALNNADVSVNKMLKASVAAGIYDDAVAIAGMVGYRPPAFEGFTIRGGVAYGIEREQYAGSFGFAAHW